MPDRLPSLIVLVAFWVPPALAGWVLADTLGRLASNGRSLARYATILAVAGVYSFAWFALNLGAMPPYIPGATPDPPIGGAPAHVVNALAIFTAAVILPGSALACAAACRIRQRTAIATPAHA